MKNRNYPLFGFYILTFLVCVINAFPEKGKWTFDINQDNHYVGVSKSMFVNTNIIIKSTCKVLQYVPLPQLNACFL